ncbi:hypothetical protein H632_c872p1 [Helicosporidium sp. ATCC 50920]|nr:hypothetical protein H632_c872p1 [Helicosporidium sp. ATCC 50920]|eukprot:KDD75097.1 hypothetical protein H632_c872p1 [Helicosporidium sp. ATCC 50920]
MATKPLQAVVIGGTGAVGSELVSVLLKSEAWSSVTSIGRREAPTPADLTPPQKAKLRQVVVDMDTLEQAGVAAMRGADSVFCALGTTRASVSSAEEYAKVDRDYVAAAAKAACTAGVPHFAMVSAQGANPNMWGPHSKLLHGLFYMRVKGEAEEAAKSSGVAFVTIARPGMIDRGTFRSLSERISAAVLPKVASAAIARALVKEGERVAAKNREDPVLYLNMAELQKA